MSIKSFAELIEKVKSKKERAVLAVVAANDAHTLEAVLKARKDGLVKPILIGDKTEISKMISDFGEESPEIYHESDVERAAKYGVQLVKEGKADILMKGKIDTKTYLSTVVNKESGIGMGGIMSFVAIHELPWYHKLLTVTDGGMLTYPNLNEKKMIIQNAVNALTAMGYDQPKVGVLAAVEKLNPKMPETVDADQLKQMNITGEIVDCVIEGPISFDIAVNKEKALLKGFNSEVAGDADILVVPDIAAGNILGKSLLEFDGVKMAGLVLGAKVPIVLTSRGAEIQEKYLSIAIAALSKSLRETLVTI